MLIDAIHLYSAAESGLDAELFAELSLGNVDETHRYILEDATGLDPDQIAPVYVGGSSESGSTEQYYDMVAPPKTIGLRIKLNPDVLAYDTYSSLREHLYKRIFRSRTSLIEIRLMYGGSVVASIRGMTTRFEGAIFSSNPIVQLTFWCPYGLFTGPSYIEYNKDDIKTGVANYTVPDDISTAPHGFKMQIKANDDLDELLIQTHVDDTVYPFKISRAFNENDIIYFSSEPSDRYLYYRSDNGAGTKHHIADKIDSNQLWPILFPEGTGFTVIGSTGIESLGDRATVEFLKHRSHFWGV